MAKLSNDFLSGIIFMTCTKKLLFKSKTVNFENRQNEIIENLK